MNVNHFQKSVGHCPNKPGVGATPPSGLPLTLVAPTPATRSVEAGTGLVPVVGPNQDQQ